jgi:cytochrome c oxidase cbb3-type subunit III
MSPPRARCALFVVSAMLALGCTRDKSAAPKPEQARVAPDASSLADAAHASADAHSAAPVPSAERGAALYTRMCAVCHGNEGQGYVADQAPALAQPDFLATVSDPFLSFAIAVGRRGTTMSAWQSDHGGPLSPYDVLDLIAHLRSWQKEPTRPPVIATLAGDVERGKRLFTQHCESCHGPKAPYVHILNRQFLVYAQAPFLRQAIEKGRTGTKMAAFAEALGAQGVEDVVAYLRDLPSWPVPGELPGNSAPPPIPLGPVPLHAHGPEPRGFHALPDMTSVDVVARELARGARMVLLDARAPSDYKQSHIAGAVSVPFYDPSPYLEALPKDAWLVCYCGCPHAESGSLAKQLKQVGFRKVTVLDEGLGVWSEKGHPVRSGLEP